jgi:small redox-active disulfide protein 2
MTDTPLQRQIKIGQATIGLVGLDIALSQAIAYDRGRTAANKSDRQETLAQLFKSVADKNYIPAGMRNAYREALTKEYDRLQGGEAAKDETLTIRILGPGCVSCNNIQKLVFEIMHEMQVKADIFQIHDLDEIGRMGVLQTPALIINGELKSAGRLPTKSQIEEWIRESIENQNQS